MKTPSLGEVESSRPLSCGRYATVNSSLMVKSSLMAKGGVEILGHRWKGMQWQVPYLRHLRGWSSSIIETKESEDCCRHSFAGRKTMKG